MEIIPLEIKIQFMVLVVTAFALGFLVGYAYIQNIIWDKIERKFEFKLKKERIDPTTHCPNCRRHFSEWFFWPGKGDYCYPCWKETGKIIVRRKI